MFTKYRFGNCCIDGLVNENTIQGITQVAWSVDVLARKLPLIIQLRQHLGSLRHALTAAMSFHTLLTQEVPKHILPRAPQDRSLPALSRDL
jgi:hypothetical protein